MRASFLCLRFPWGEKAHTGLAPRLAHIGGKGYSDVMDVLATANLLTLIHLLAHYFHFTKGVSRNMRVEKNSLNLGKGEHFPVKA